MRTFLRRLGNKTNHLKHIIPLIPEFTGAYFEPFLGTGAAYLDFLPKKVILNDLNKDIISIWKLIKKDPEYIINEINLFKTTFLPLSNEDKLKTCKKILNDMDNFDKKKRTVMYLLMTYCSFNGNIILSNKFYIGGLYKHFFYNNSIHIFTEKYKEKLRDLSQILKKVKIYSKDYKLVLKEAKQGDFVFLDPPYIEEKKYAFNYNKNETFNITELKNELTLLDTRNVKWMMAQIDTKETRKIFGKYNIIEYTNKNSFNNGITLKNELIIKNY
jgi:DNA adenine methylase